jgi:ABC-type branched-subunit amino acid transport system ATPase component
MRDQTAGIEPCVLEAHDVTVRYGGLTALSEVSVRVPRGAIIGLLGPNGAGKSTLLGVLSGDVTPKSGQVSLDGRDVTRTAPQNRVRLGLARTFQHPEVYGELTVWQHLALAYRLRRQPSRVWSDPFTGRFLRASAAEDKDIAQLVSALGLAEVAHSPLANLPLGVSRLVELGRALATEPSVVMLDEPSSGLDAEESKRLAAVLKSIVADRGTSFLLVEHDVEMVFGLSSRVSVLDFGSLIAEGTPQGVQADARVRSAYLGELAPAESAAPAARPAESACRPAGLPVTASDVLLDVRDLVVKYGNAVAVGGLSLMAARGSVTALLGSNGAGKSTLARALVGLVPASAGTIHFDGTDISRMPPRQINKLGLAYLPEGRGVFPTLTVNENLSMAVQRLPAVERSAAIDHAVELFPVLGERRRQLAGTLSGGQQQMLSLARVLARAPRLLIADEVSLGLAPVIVDEVFAALKRAIADGVAVILIEQFVHRALELADTCHIMRRGSVVWSGAASDARAEVIEHYLGSDIEPDALSGVFG